MEIHPNKYGESLFNLAVDEREQADFKDDEPETLARLRAEFNKWESGVLKYPKA